MFAFHWVIENKWTVKNSKQGVSGRSLQNWSVPLCVCVCVCVSVWKIIIRSRYERESDKRGDREEGELMEVAPLQVRNGALNSPFTMGKHPCSECLSLLGRNKKREGKSCLFPHLISTFTHWAEYLSTSFIKAVIVLQPCSLCPGWRTGGSTAVTLQKESWRPCVSCVVQYVDHVTVWWISQRLKHTDPRVGLWTSPAGVAHSLAWHARTRLSNWARSSYEGGLHGLDPIDQGYLAGIYIWQKIKHIWGGVLLNLS